MYLLHLGSQVSGRTLTKRQRSACRRLLAPQPGQQLPCLFLQRGSCCDVPAIPLGRLKLQALQLLLQSRCLLLPLTKGRTRLFELVTPAQTAGARPLTRC